MAIQRRVDSLTQPKAKVVLKSKKHLNIKEVSINYVVLHWGVAPSSSQNPYHSALDKTPRE